MTDIEPHKSINQKIYLIRNQRVLMDSDLAKLYGVETGALNRAVRRNSDRFPKDFMFQITEIEQEVLKCQLGISSSDAKSWGGRRHRPYAFTEQGVAMLSSVLRSKKAALVNIEIMRAFVQTRKLITSNTDLAEKIIKLESKYDSQFKIVFDAIKQLMQIPDKPKKKIGIIQEK